MQCTAAMPAKHTITTTIALLHTLSGSRETNTRTLPNGKKKKRWRGSTIHGLICLCHNGLNWRGRALVCVCMCAIHPLLFRAKSQSRGREKTRQATFSDWLSAYHSSRPALYDWLPLSLESEASLLSDCRGPLVFHLTVCGAMIDLAKLRDK